MSDNGNIKKRRVGDGSVEEDSASSELTAIKSLLQEVLNQNRINNYNTNYAKGYYTVIK